MDWIPVTERLPDKNGKYLCSIQSNFKRKKIMRISTTDFESGINRWSPDCMAFKDRVIAWMPLPEPYVEPTDEPSASEIRGEMFYADMGDDE